MGPPGRRLARVPRPFWSTPLTDRRRTRAALALGLLAAVPLAIGVPALLLQAQPDTTRKPDVVYVPTPPEVVDKMLELAEVTKDDVVYDLGCGDGRIPVAAATKFGCKAFGFDIDPDRVRESHANVKKNGVEKLVTIEQKDIFTLDLSGATVVTLYLLPDLNVRLIPQLQKLKPGSRIVSHAFDMRGVKPKKEVTVQTPDGRQRNVYLWVAPIEVSKE
jgi:SAM-dependent methyltransferase